MRKSTFAVFGVILAAAIALMVSGLVAQTREPQRPERSMPGLDSDCLGRDLAMALRELGPRLRALEPTLREIEPRLRELAPRLREIEPRLREQLRQIEPHLREFRFDGPMSFDFDMLPRSTSPRGRLGVQLGNLTPQLSEYFGAPDGGVLVSSVTKDSAAEKAGLKAGDVITSINGDRVRDADDLIDELRDANLREIIIGIVRDRKESRVEATLDDSQQPARRPPL